MNVATAFAVGDPSQVSEPRRAVQTLAARAGLSDEQIGRAALVVSELATNLAKHARGGEMLMRPLTSPSGELDGVEVLALDKGPGIPDVALSRRDGYSTTGTLGHGLGAIERQADWFDLYTHPSGTAIAARLWGTPPDRRRLPRMDVAAAHVAKSGEPICGDGWTWRMRDDRLAIFVADGLGHGMAAHDAADAAVRVFEQYHEEAPARVVADVHAAIRNTRGAAVAALAVDLARGVGRFAGVGNIGGTILLAAGGAHRMVSHPGTAGHTAGRIQEFTYPVPPGSIVVLFSDGLGTQWNLSAYPGIQGRSASVIAGVLYRDYSRRRDDVTVVVAKDRPAVAEKL
ncbi:MAG TPA: ATP-binding SpoIIE family protein phosphatase [Actinomycetota bacterium]|nr:ATP-binding SpoIIE family protein phosphatase [Actinomycetota bacterium]